MKKPNNISKISFALGLGTLSFLFLVVTLTSIAFLFHGSVSIVWLIVSLLGSLAITYWRLVKAAIKRPLLWVGLLFVLFAGSVIVSAQTFDSTWDGNDYHKTAIGEMTDGWNPVWEKMIDFHNSSRNPLYSPDAQGQFRDYLTNWTDHYPKASWIFAANIYKLTGSIESGKAITILSMVMVFCFALSFFYATFGRNKSLILTLILTFNPIVVSQVFTFYNDGTMGNFIIVLLILLSMLISKQAGYIKQRWLLLFGIGMSIAVMVNFKFSALAYAAIVAGCYYVYLLFRRDWKLVRQLTLTGVISVVVGILVIGASSYVVNTIRNHNPIFPLAGQGKIDIMSTQQPADYANESGIHKFISNNLYATTNLSYSSTTVPHIKIPFTITMDELSELQGSADDRQAGYGVWFGGILIITTLAAIFLLVHYGRKYKEYLPLILLPLITIAVTVLAFDNTWWARYLPQLIIFPVIVIAVLFTLRAKVLPYIIAFAVLFNVTLTGLLDVSYEAFFDKTSLTAIKDTIHCNDKKPITIGYGRFYGAVYDIRDYCKNIIITNLEPSQVPQNKQIPLYEQVYQLVD